MSSEWSSSTDLLVPLSNIDYNPPLFEELAAKGVVIKRVAPMDSSIVLDFVRDEFSQNWYNEVEFALYHRNCWIAEDNGHVVGFVVINAQAPDFVGPIGVARSHQGLGIARALTIRAFEGLYNQGYRYAICGWISYSVYQYVNKYITKAVPLPDSSLSSYGNRISTPSARKDSVQKTIYLTFDDGPSEITPILLDTLQKHEVKATFFVTNKYNRPELIKSIHDAGHQIGLHSYTHEYSDIYASDEAFFQDVEQISRLVEEQTGTTSKLFRFPGGTSNIPVMKKGGLRIYRLISSLKEQGYRIFDWNVESQDGMRPNLLARDYFSNFLQQIEGLKEVVLLAHNRPQDAESVKSIDLFIEYCKAQGYSFKTLDDCADMPLIATGRYKLHPYYRTEKLDDGTFMASNGETGKRIPLSKVQYDFLTEKCDGVYRIDEHANIVDALMLKWACSSMIIVPAK